MTRSVPFTQARAALSDLLDDVERLHEHVVITRNGTPAAVLLSAAEYEAIEETLDILRDQTMLDALAESERDVRAGRLTSLAELRRQLGLA